MFRSSCSRIEIRQEILEERAFRAMKRAVRWITTWEKIVHNATAIRQRTGKVLAQVRIRMAMHSSRPARIATSPIDRGSRTSPLERCRDTFRATIA
ncbi:MAG: hypothetical protein A2X94_00160 [Bdellovibrionales bacterium GWB1_55_8]|nr:MAG: hypothetical protein A2X94_00160 [Bdellovibrionales bacterium GWB1_55_8]